VLRFASKLRLCIYKCNRTVKRTYQPKKLKTLRKFGFRSLMSSVGGKNVIKRRRKRGRKFLTKSDLFRVVGKKPNKRIR